MNMINADYLCKEHRFICVTFLEGEWMVMAQDIFVVILVIVVVAATIYAVWNENAGGDQNA